MAIKRIDELGAATPLLTDFLPATPTGGPSAKATVKQLYESNLFAVSVAYTGTAPPPFGAIVSAKSGAQSDSTLTIPDGVTIETFVYSNGSSATLTYANLTGIRSTFTMSTWVNLTSLSFPVLNAIGVNFSPTIMASLTTLSIPALAVVIGSFSPTTMALLTTLSAPALTFVGGAFAPATMASLTTLSIPALTYVGVSFSPITMASLTTLSIPALTYVGVTFSPSTMASLTTLSAPALTYTGSGFSPTTMASLTTLSIPALTFVGTSFAPTSMAALVTLSAPALKSIGTLNGFLQPATLPNLTTLTFPVIEIIGVFSSLSINIVTGTAALSTFTLGSTLQRVDSNVIITSAALLVASVDGLLVRLAALDGTGLTTAYSSKTVTITGTSATPSATGLAAKATLVARGCTVTHN